MTILYTEKGPGLHERIAAAGHWLANVDGVWQSSDDEAVQAIIDAYTLDDARAPIIEAIKRSAQDRIVAFLPMWKQSNCNARANELNAETHRLSVKRVAGGGLSDEEAARELAIETELRGLQVLWERAKAVRTASDVHEANLSRAASFAAVLAYDITVGWPE